MVQVYPEIPTQMSISAHTYGMCSLCLGGVPKKVGAKFTIKIYLSK